MSARTQTCCGAMQHFKGHGCGLETFLKVGTVGISLDAVQPTCRPSRGRGWGPGFGLACCMGRTSKRLVFTGRELQVPHHRHLDVPQPPCCTQQRVLCVRERESCERGCKSNDTKGKSTCAVLLCIARFYRCRIAHAGHRFVIATVLPITHLYCAALRITRALMFVRWMSGKGVCCVSSCFSLCGGTFVHVVDTVVGDCALSSTLPRLRLHQMHTVSRVSCACECVVVSTRVPDGVWLLLRDGKEVQCDISLSCGVTRDWTLCQAHRVAPLAH
jgi:hypothetical protein